MVVRSKKVHGRLLGAAIDAQRPVQICVICYVNQQGELDLVAPFIVEMSFAEHVQRVLEMPKLPHLLTLPAIPVTHHTVDSLTRRFDRQMRAGLLELQSKVFKYSAITILALNYIKPSIGSHEIIFIPAFCHHFILGFFGVDDRTFVVFHVAM